MLKITAAAALLAASLSASAMTAIADQDLSAVAGQDGVSIAADLNINIGSFTYSDYTDAAHTTGGSVSFNGITVRGLMTMTIDVLGANDFKAAALTSIATGQGLTGTGDATTASILGQVGAALGYANQDVVQFAFPAAGDGKAAHALTPTITIDSITTAQNDATGAHTGTQGASFGSIQIKNLDLQGTKVWMFGHN